MKITRLGSYIILTIIAILFIVPFVWVFEEGFSSVSNIGFGDFGHFTLSAYSDIFHVYYFRLAIINGLIQSLGGMAFSIAFSILAAYVFSRRRFPGRIAILLTILFFTGFPVFSLLIPTYVFYIKTVLYNTQLGVILFLGVLNLPITVWLLKNSFDQIPKSIEKAAIIDGASPIQSIFNVFLPMAFPSIAVLILLDFITNWGNFYVPYILLSSQHLFPISVYIYSYFGAYSVKYNELAAAAVIYTIPTLILYIFAQKYLIKAFSIGGVKG
jgi:multiple sugar transport system permease protein